MASRKQIIVARKNIKKAQKAWKGVSHRQRALVQPEGRARKKPGMGGAGRFYHIEVRPKSEFISFRNQDVGHKGGLERLAGRRSSGSWDTVTWLVGKDLAHVEKNGQLIIDDPKARTMLKQIRGNIFHKKGDIFHAHPRSNVPESAKPTMAMRRAERINIKKAQTAWRKMKP
ncbi:MAG: hypothetical protein A3D65_05795 [Candidatus Lloydbacteria bacterium RIFCSPHIGHO2_02_FULL_50_13]|uniref:Uncharacterized protein n=1 Tax=Candidatus Lloydbacteria bacterium RIFCSPHIGHO2_02_FULL_50_13 TaxID=1798661 RepID=A0A1G2DCB9_9BACT|nr:MAG: hypothetical protein A3D65_05795 [Candidatus Lloydbacteria bacterium RIFCSPHIGHO2_02_FULL_50_13]